MRALLQRVRSASVTIAGEQVGAIGQGWAILLGVAIGDKDETADRLADRAAHLRCFADESGKMNISALDVGAEILVVSQFTLYADTAHGRRPSYVAAAAPDVAAPLVDRFVQRLRELGLNVATGRFGADMLVDIANDGPVTIMLDSDDRR